jgi:hypothetical protein
MRTNEVGLMTMPLGLEEPQCTMLFLSYSELLQFSDYCLGSMPSFQS